MDRHFRDAQKIVAGRRDLRDKVLFLSVSFDPAFDTPAILRGHAASVGADLTSWRFLTGDAGTIERFATRFGVSVIHETDKPGIITHNLRTSVIGPDGRLVTTLSGGDWTTQDLVTALASASHVPS
jgi:protein SCO1/2